MTAASSRSVAGGIFPTSSQVPLLTPLTRQNCGALASTTLPDGQKFDRMVELSMIPGEGKNIFDNQVTTEAYPDGGECPDPAHASGNDGSFR